jgi:hypothetical protein
MAWEIAHKIKYRVHISRDAGRALGRIYKEAQEIFDAMVLVMTNLLWADLLHMQKISEMSHSRCSCEANPVPAPGAGGPSRNADCGPHGVH